MKAKISVGQVVFHRVYDSGPGVAIYISYNDIYHVVWLHPTCPVPGYYVTNQPSWRSPLNELLYKNTNTISLKESIEPGDRLFISPNRY